PECRLPQTARHSKAIGHLAAPCATKRDPGDVALGKLVHLVPRDLVARDQERSGIESFTSIASKTDAIAYRSSIGSTKPHARIALEMSSLSSVFGNSSNPATDSSSSYSMSSNRATLSSVMRTFKSAKALLTSGVGHMRSVEGSKNSLFILSIGAPLLCARMNAAVIACPLLGLSPAGKAAPWKQGTG